MSKPIAVEVVYALPYRQTLIKLDLPAKTTVKDALELSGLTAHFPEFDWTNPPVGIFGNLCPLERVLQTGDRIEIYRPLTQDPKTARRRRAAKL
jgi:putative ubiquitin-RnfH superfamily antitoxin RatB of RatAB toxin-antitoxin module